MRCLISAASAYAFKITHASVDRSGFQMHAGLRTILIRGTGTGSCHHRQQRMSDSGFSWAAKQTFAEVVLRLYHGQTKNYRGGQNRVRIADQHGGIHRVAAREIEQSVAALHPSSVKAKRAGPRIRGLLLALVRRWAFARVTGTDEHFAAIGER